MDVIRTFYRDLTLKPQGITIVVAAFLPIIAIVAMGPAVPTMIEHFANDPEARAKVPAMIGAPGLAMAILAPFAGMLVDRFGRRPILLFSTLFYAIFGAAPLLLDSLDQIYASRLLLGISEAGILTVVNTLIGDYWDDRGRKNWLFLQGILGPFIAAIFSLIVGYASQIQWNGVFYVYLIALPIFVAMLLYLFEPKRADTPSGRIPARNSFPMGQCTDSRGRHAVCVHALLCFHHQRCTGVQGGRRYRAGALCRADLCAQPVHSGRGRSVPFASDAREPASVGYVHGAAGNRIVGYGVGNDGAGDDSLPDHPANSRRNDRADVDRMDARKVRL